MIVFDIETVPQPGLESLPAWAHHVERHSAQNLTLQNAALSPEFGMIVSICASYCDPYRDVIYDSFESTGPDEGAVIAAFSRFLLSTRETVLAGHYIKGFDIPFYAKRCMRYGLEIPTHFRTHGKKPWDLVHIDTAEVMQFCGPARPSLEACCHLLGIPSPKQDLDGPGVWEAFLKGEYPRIGKYCRGDVRAVYEIIQALHRTKGIQ